MGVDTTLLLVGIGCLVAAVVGGGIKLSKMEFPTLTSVPRQILLFLIGAAIVALSFGVKTSSKNSEAGGSETATPAGEAAVVGDKTHDLPPAPAVRVTANPAALDFGDIATDEEASEFVTIAVEGVDEHSWSFEPTGTFFVAKKMGQGISVQLRSKPGRYRGMLVISSKAGQTVVRVRANVIRPVPREADTPAGEPDNSRRREPQSPSAADISGRWSLNGGIMDFSPTERAGRYRFTELSSAAFLGANVPMGQGTATVTGNEATLVGQNQFMGPWSAEVSILGQQMQGTLSWFGNQVTFAMKRL